MYASCDDLNKFHVHIPILPSSSSFKKKVPKQQKFTIRALQSTYIKRFVVLILFLNSDKNVWSSTYI